MDEFAVVMKARELVGKVNPTKPPAPIQDYIEAVGARLRVDETLSADEPGYSFPDGKGHRICVNVHDTPERRNFTICHEIAHISLGLPADHGRGPWWSYAKRPPNEVLCDVFAAELLLPARIFKPIANRLKIGFDAIEKLAGDFEASISATGSRYATVAGLPCAFVLSEQGKVRYASRSKGLREVSAWIRPGMELPLGSFSEKLRNRGAYDGAEEIAADFWFEDWSRGGMLFEDARHVARWDQTLSLLWFSDEDEIPPPQRGDCRPDDEEGLRELDGTLPWPGRSKRRR